MANTQLSPSSHPTPHFTPTCHSPLCHSRNPQRSHRTLLSLLARDWAALLLAFFTLSTSHRLVNTLHFIDSKIHIFPHFSISEILAQLWSLSEVFVLCNHGPTYSIIHLIINEKVLYASLRTIYSFILKKRLIFQLQFVIKIEKQHQLSSATILKTDNFF